MNIEEFRAAFIQAMQPLIEFMRQVRDIFLEMAQRLRKALAPLWNASALHQKRASTSLSQMCKGGNRQERRIAWKVLHTAKHHQRIRATAPHRLKPHPSPYST